MHRCYVYIFIDIVHNYLEHSHAKKAYLHERALTSLTLSGRAAGGSVRRVGRGSFGPGMRRHSHNLGPEPGLRHDRNRVRREDTMTFATLMKSSTALSVAALLALSACGGGGSGTGGETMMPDPCPIQRPIQRPIPTRIRRPRL